MKFLKVMFLAVSLVPAVALAQVCTQGGELVFTQPPNQVNGLFSDADCDGCASGMQSIADDFMLAGSTNIGELQLYGGYFPTNVPSDPDDITVIFHEDLGGLPGAAISTQASVSATKIDTGVDLFGVDEYFFVLTLANPVRLSAGHFWVEIFNNTAGTTESFFWETGDLSPISGVFDGAFSVDTPGGAWGALGGVDMAFNMCTAVNKPIPTLGNPGLLALIALLGLFLPM